MAKKILITGGAGFIGYHLACELAENSASELVLVDNFSKGVHDDAFDKLIAKANVKFYYHDLTEPDLGHKVGFGFDEVYHLAALLGVENVILNPYKTLRINTLTVFNLLDWLNAGGGKKVVFASTSEVMAWTQNFYELPIPTPEDVPLALTDLKKPRSTYAASKFYGELAFIHFCQENNIDYSLLRYGNIYGPRMGFTHAMPQIYKKIHDRQNPLEVYSCSYTRSFCYIDDCVRLTRQVMEDSRANGEVFNASSDGEEISIGDLAKLMLKIEGADLPIKGVFYEDDNIPRRCLSMKKAKKLLGFETKVKLEAGLKKTLRWYKDFYEKKS